MTANTLANPANKQETITASINERKLLDSVRHMFTTSWTLFGELMQNARRAHGTKVEFTMEGTNCTVKDDGDGVKDFSKFVAICESGWDNQTMIEENPFGMGFLSCLMAAEQVEIHSGNKMVRISLKAVQDKDPIHVQNTSSMVVGTEIRLMGLEAKWCQTCEIYGTSERSFLLENKLKDFARGFPIDVYFNGKKLARPHAKSALAGTETEIGFVSVDGVDRDVAKAENITAMPKSFSNALYYLQGLPIGRPTGSDFIVHLDTKRFLPRVPDRTQLYDEAASLQTIEEVVKQHLRNLLVAFKRTLDPKVFVLRFWSHCWELGVPHLLQDIPYVPLRLFKTAIRLTRDSQETFEGCRYGLEDKLVPIEDFQSGAVRVFYTPHTSVDFEDRYGIEVLNFLEHFKLLCTSKTFKGHWLADYLVNCDDLLFEMTPVNLVDSGQSSYCWGDLHAEIILCESVELKVTSLKHPELVYSDVLTDAWYARNPADYWTEEKRDSVQDWTLSEEVEVYVPQSSGGYGISDIMASFTDEYDKYDDEAREMCEDDIVNLVSSLRGLPLAKMLDRNINFERLNLDVKHIGNMAFVHVVHSESVRRHPSLALVDMDTAYFDAMAQRLLNALSAPGVTLTGDLLKSAMVTPPATEETTTEG